MFHHHLHQFHTTNTANIPSNTNCANNIYELHSTASFFTSNPLLYVSHYSEIIVHHHAAAPSAGYEQSAGASSPHAAQSSPAGRRAAMPLAPQQSLTHQRQLVELLDAHALTAYLLQNGALSQQDVDEIESAESRARGNVWLLRAVEARGRHAQHLLVNALRQTGQLHLASLLDEGMRIKAFSGSGYLSKKRRRGQVSIEIEVRAIKVPQESVSSYITPKKTAITTTSSPADTAIYDCTSAPVSPARAWVSVDDIRQRLHALAVAEAEAQVAAQQLSAVQQFQLVETQDEAVKSRCCLCACFSALFSSSSSSKKNKHKSTSSKIITTPLKKSSRDRSEQYKHGDTNGNGVHLSASVNGLRSGSASPNRYISQTTRVTSASSPKLTTDSDTAEKQARAASMENLQCLLDMLQQKTDILYSVLQDSSSATRISLLKYLEQSRGVLVLETEPEERLVIISICTKFQQLDSIKRDFASGKLNQDLEECIVTEEVLTKMGVQGLKIKTLVSEDDLELAEQELG